jgi:hypothetical protein
MSKVYISVTLLKKYSEVFLTGTPLTEIKLNFTQLKGVVGVENA